MSYSDFNSSLEKDNLLSSYLFIGEEKYLIDVTIKNIKDRYVDESFESINYTVLDGKNINQEDIVNACETLPFMSTKKMVILNEVTSFLAGGINNEKEFYDYIEDIGEHCIFIVIDRNGDLKKTTKFYKFFKKKNSVVEFNKLNRSQLIKWIEEQLKLNNRKMNISNINYFMDRTSYFSKNQSTDLYSLKGDINKLISYTDDVEIIKADIESHSHKSLDNNIFDLLGSISEGNSNKAVRVFNELYALNEPSLKILFMITRQVRLLLNYKLFKGKGYQDKDIGIKLKIKPYELNKISKQSSNYTINELKKYFNHLLMVDKKLKTSSTDDKLEMEMLILRISTGMKEK